MEEEKIPLDKNNPDSIYNWLGLKIKSPSFRNIIKDFIDDNCSLFIDVDENTFQQGQLFNEFTQLIENILGDLLLEGGITQEQFLTAAERGLNDPNYKKYFDQLLNFSDYTYFKKMMTQRNYHLIQEVEKEMEKKPEPKKEEFKIQKNDMINFEQKEKPISNIPSISTNKNSFNIISNNDNFQVSGCMTKE